MLFLPFPCVFSLFWGDVPFIDVFILVGPSNLVIPFSLNYSGFYLISKVFEKALNGFRKSFPYSEKPLMVLNFFFPDVPFPFILVEHCVSFYYENEFQE